jgi:hypothetical protein
MEHFFVTLEDFPAGGDVITSDGEIIGTYTCDEIDYLEFKKNGSDDVIIAGFHVGPFCKEIAEWHGEQEPN